MEICGLREIILMVKKKVLETYFQDGELYEEGSYVNNKREGIWKECFIQGSTKPCLEGSYISGEKEGVWKAYYHNGELYVEQYYLAGGLLGVKSWYENGQLKIEMIKNLIIDEALRYIETVEIEYYENGQLKSKNITKDRSLYEAKMWYENGQLKKEITDFEKIEKCWDEEGNRIECE